MEIISLLVDVIFSRVNCLTKLINILSNVSQLNGLNIIQYVVECFSMLLT